MRGGCGVLEIFEWNYIWKTLRSLQLLLDLIYPMFFVEFEDWDQVIYIKPNYVSGYLIQNQEYFILKVCWLYSRCAEGGIASGMKDS